MLARILETADFTRFHRDIMALSRRVGMSHTMVGFNYAGDHILSTKFYYVFQGDVAAAGEFPIPGLREAYAAQWRDASSYHLGARLVAGAGLTLAIKFDPALNVTRAFFFRVRRPNDALVGRVVEQYPELCLAPGDFDDGHGQYVVEEGGRIRTSEYLYLNRVDRLRPWEDTFDVRFSRADCVEIAAAASADRAARKFIAIGLDDRMGPRFREAIPAPVRQVLAGLDGQLCCPAVAPDGDLRSVYVIGRLRERRFACSPVEALLARAGGKLPGEPA